MMVFVGLFILGLVCFVFYLNHSLKSRMNFRFSTFPFLFTQITISIFFQFKKKNHFEDIDDVDDNGIDDLTSM